MSNFRQYGQIESRDGKSQRREGKRRTKKEDQKRESLRRKKIQVREKVKNCMPLWREAHF